MSSYPYLSIRLKATVEQRRSKRRRSRYLRGPRCDAAPASWWTKEHTRGVKRTRQLALGMK